MNVGVSAFAPAPTLWPLLNPTDGETPDWRMSGNCARPGMDEMQPDVASVDEVETLKRVCVSCPVRLECNQLAKSQPGAYGVHDGHWWGPAPERPVVGDDLGLDGSGELPA